MKPLDTDTVADCLALCLALFIKRQLFWVTANTITSCVGSAGLRHLQVVVLFLKGFKDEGDDPKVAVPDLMRHLVGAVAPVPPANAPSLLFLHVILQLPVGGMNLL